VNPGSPDFNFAEAIELPKISTGGMAERSSPSNCGFSERVGTETTKKQSPAEDKTAPRSLRLAACHRVPGRLF
jgi:hypothetical protein